MRVPRILEGSMGSGTVLILLGATCFSVKSIFIKLAYRHGVDAATLLTLRMSFALPFFLAVAAVKWRGRDQTAIAARDWAGVLVMGLLGYYFASYLDFLGLQYISAGLERLILFLYPTFVMLLSARVTGLQITRREVLAAVLSYAGIAMAVYADLWHTPASPWRSTRICGSSSRRFCSAAASCWRARSASPCIWWAARR
jgi:drug/metabolite transporter (DMT)-like permease